MKVIVLTALAASIAFAQPATTPTDTATITTTLQKASPIIDQAEKMRADLMQAQRDYQVARAPFEQQIATLPATKALQAQIQSFNEFCSAQDKDPNYETGRCQPKPEKKPEVKPGK